MIFCGKKSGASVYVVVRLPAESVYGIPTFVFLFVYQSVTRKCLKKEKNA